MKYYLIATTFIAIVFCGCAENSTNPATTPEPTSYPTEFKVALTTDSSVTVIWKDAVQGELPGFYYIIGVEDSDTIPEPEDGISPVLGTLGKVVAQGTQNVTFTNLKSEKSYSFAIYPFTGEASSINYKTSGSIPKLTSTTAEYSGWMPLKIGNTWIYSHTYYDTLVYNGGGNNGGGSTPAGTSTLTIEKDTLINGVKWYKSLYTGSDNSIQIGYLTNSIKKDELWLLGGLMGFYCEKPGVIFKKAEANTSYYPYPGALDKVKALTNGYPEYRYEMRLVIYTFSPYSGISKSAAYWQFNNGTGIVHSSYVVKLESMILK